MMRLAGSQRLAGLVTHALFITALLFVSAPLWRAWVLLGVPIRTYGGLPKATPVPVVPPPKPAPSVPAPVRQDPPTLDPPKPTPQRLKMSRAEYERRRARGDFGCFFPRLAQLDRLVQEMFQAQAEQQAATLRQLNQLSDQLRRTPNVH